MATARPIGSSRDSQPRNWWREAVVVLGILAFGLFVLSGPDRGAVNEIQTPADLVE
jgi:hypothetical protein